MSTSILDVYMALDNILTGSIPLRDLLWAPTPAADFPPEVRELPRIWTGHAPRDTPLSILLLQEPNEAAYDTFGTDGNEGRIRITADTPYELRHLGGAAIAQVIYPLLESEDIPVPSGDFKIWETRLEYVHGFGTASPIASYRTVWDWYFKTARIA